MPFWILRCFVALALVLFVSAGGIAVADEPVAEQPGMQALEEEAAPMAAQEAEPEADRVAPPTIEEIVVTARRREESMQKTPVSITAFSETELERQSIQDFNDLEASMPNLIMRVVGSRTSSSIPVIRGIPKGSDVATVDAPSGVYVNEVYIARSKGLNNAMFDLQRVELLRGPQGTLFGRNSTGGNLLITTRRPSNEWGAGYFRVKLGQHQRIGFEGATSIPITEDLSARVASSTLKRDGYVRSCIGGSVDGSDCEHRQNVDDENYRTYRLSLLWEPSDRFSTLVVYDNYWEDNNGTGVFATEVAPGSALAGIAGGFFAAPVLEAIEQARLSRHRTHRRTASERRQFGRTRNHGLMLRSSYEISENVSSNLILAYRHLDVRESFDIDGASNLVLFTNQVLDNVKQHSGELQLSGTALEDRLDWIGGLYWFREDGRDTSTSPSFGGARPATTYGPFTHWSQSVFAEFTYHFPGVEGLSLTLGGRWTRDDREFTAKHVATVRATGETLCRLFEDDDVTPLPADACRRKDSDAWSEPTYNVTLQYQWSDRTQMYLAHRHGYNSGGYNLRAAREIEFQPFDEQKVTDLEAGLKTDFYLGDVAFRTNLAAYYLRFDDKVESTIAFSPGSNSLLTVLQNAAEADSWGGELEVTAETERLTVRLGLGIAVGRYKDFFDSGQNASRDGDPFVGVPDWTLNGSVRYQLPTENLLGGGFGPMAVQVDFVRYDDMLLTSSVNFAPVKEEYALANLRVDWTPGDGDYEIGFWVKNLFDQTYTIATVDLRGTLGNLVENYGPPRLWGVDLTYRF